MSINTKWVKFQLLTNTEYSRIFRFNSVDVLKIKLVMLHAVWLYLYIQDFDIIEINGYFT